MKGWRGLVLGGPSDGTAGRLLRAVAVGTLVLPTLLFALFAWEAWTGAMRQARERLWGTAGLVLEHAVKVFETQELVGAQVAEIIRGLDATAARAAAEGLHLRLRAIQERLPQVEDIWLIDGAARPVVAARTAMVPSDLEVGDRDYFRVHFEQAKAETYVGPVIRGRVRGATFFQMSWRVANAAGFDGVVVVSVRPAYFQEFYAGIHAETGFTASLFRADGSVLARFPPPRQPLDMLPPSDPFAAAIAEAPEGGSFRTRSSFDGAERIVAYRRLPRYPIYVTAGAAIADVRARWLATTASHLAFGLPVTLSLFAVTLVALARVRRENAALAQLRAESLRREATEAQLRQSQKMDAIGRLTGGVAHDFNNLLTVVTGNLDLVLRRLGDGGDPRVRRGVQGALEGARRAAALTQRLLAFARQQPLDPRPTDANRLVAGMSDLLRRTLGETVEVETVLAGGLWPVFVDAPQLENALLNLAVNARDAMPAGGKLTIETANTHLDDAYARAHDEVAPGQYVMIAVSDTGIGMPPEVIARAFDPFFTTKPLGEGTGLGLSQVFGFVKQSGGHVKIYSEPGEGTAVKVYLPRHVARSREADDAIAATAAEERELGHGRSVLVVEDDPGVRRFSVECLSDLGYRVLEAADGASALQLLDRHPEVALLFTDVVLPHGMNGRRLADEARRRRPDLAVLFTTGYTQNAIVHHGTLDPGVDMIGKPFTQAELARKLAQVIGRRARS
ncbi:ATP-binding protein [Stella sp.]|uniref:ATP-binding protein n=1 Tax=Stella sp. TaxID=2912054 RepID=UPI0035B2DA20